MFVDASVIIAMMTCESEARIFARRMHASTVRMTSPMAVAKAAVSVGSILAMPMTEVETAIKAFLQIMNIQLLAVPPRAAFLAADAHQRFGKGYQAADLDLDDCMTYACARYYRQPLLFKGGNLGKTDIEVA
ncbi:type II toxin-antitoxin system VapC family toxin [Rhizobium tubonense]|uniref:VapC toxin family PIN domain ribonuclease n=1 Tax=Rhizobium tubonense TaxID=484088 RepID=A0A2W4CM56_9HYPH|nr:type II toxin-antitoxin system VapC family toxin [Rhizobium tubonense]PZM11495.1 VapC toxin family PIN domain ribonuclease [Rhizobium tubonense]